MKKIFGFCTIFIFLLLTGCNKKNIVTDIEVIENYAHTFSVSDTVKVRFAKGNLEYNPKKNIWKFADNQYDVIGEDNQLISDDYDGFIDLFSWGSTGYKISPTYYVDDASVFGNGYNNLSGNYDFGEYLASSLGDGYRMFTHDEIHYLLMYRKNASNLFGYGTINGIKGLFILPDDYKEISSIKFIPSTKMGFENQYNWYYTIKDGTNYNYNNFTLDEWNTLENNGVVFLPVTGMRFNTELSHVGISGHYWTSSFYGEEFANCLCLFEKDLFLEGNFDRNTGLAVRLIKEV